jgi:hypothetical protein
MEGFVTRRTYRLLMYSAASQHKATETKDTTLAINHECREDFDAIQDVTKFKTAAGWGADPMKSVDSKVKAAFTRSFNKAGLTVRTTIMIEDGKKVARKTAWPAAAAAHDIDGLGGELADVRSHRGCLIRGRHQACSGASTASACVPDLAARPTAGQGLAIVIPFVPHAPCPMPHGACVMHRTHPCMAKAT